MGSSPLEVLAEEAAAAGAVMSVHARAYTRLTPGYALHPGPAHHIRAVRELVELARRTGVRLQVSHLAVVGRRTWPSTSAVLDEFDAADADVGFDVIPYPVGVGPLQMIFPPWAVPGLAEGRRVDAWTRARIAALARLQRRLVGIEPDDLQLLGSAVPDLAPLSGLTFSAIAARLGTSPMGAELEIARHARLAGTVAIHAFSGDATDDAPLRQLLAHPRAAVISNAALTATGAPNPAAYGAFPRQLGRYARDHAVFQLEEAIRRATSLPADRLGLRDVGCIAEGYRADLVILDPATVADAGWPQHPAGPPTGIQGVLIAGRPALQGEPLTSAGTAPDSPTHHVLDARTRLRCRSFVTGLTCGGSSAPVRSCHSSSGRRSCRCTSSPIRRPSPLCCPGRCALPMNRWLSGLSPDIPRPTSASPTTRGALFVAAEYRGERGWYCLSIPVDHDTAMIGGREQFGLPKQMAEKITLDRDGAHVVGSVVRHGVPLLRIQGEFVEPQPPDVHLWGVPAVDPDGRACEKAVNFLFKYFPAADGDPFEHLPVLIRQATLFGPAPGS